MPNRSTSRLLAFSVDKATIDQLEAIFREARAQIEREVREACELEYQERLAEITGDPPDEYRLGRAEHLKEWRDKELRRQLKEADITYVISQSDGTKDINVDSMNDLINLPNWKRKSITSLSMEVGSYHTLNASIKINAKGFIETVDYSIRGDLRSVDYYAHKLDQWMISVRRWYSNFYRVLYSPFSGLVSLFFLAFIVYASYVEVSALEVGQQLWSIIIIAASNIALTGLLLWGAFLVFPLGEFAIGDGIRRKRIRDTTAKVIAVPIVLAIIVGIISSVIANKFTTR